MTTGRQTAVTDHRQRASVPGGGLTPVGDEGLKFLPEETDQPGPPRSWELRLRGAAQSSPRVPPCACRGLVCRCSLLPAPLFSRFAANNGKWGPYFMDPGPNGGLNHPVKMEASETGSGENPRAMPAGQHKPGLVRVPGRCSLGPPHGKCQDDPGPGDPP